MEHERADSAARLARARALLQARQPLPADLAAWVDTQLGKLADARAIREERDRCLRQAAAIAGGTQSEQVRRILDEAAQLRRAWPRYRAQEPEPGTVRGAVHRARLLAAIPGRTQLHAIVGGVRSKDFKPDGDR